MPQVHIITKDCSPRDENNKIRWVAYCNCAVAVRSGRDVFIISKCDGFLTKHMFSCEDNAMTIIEEGREKYKVSITLSYFFHLTLQIRKILSSWVI